MVLEVRVGVPAGEGDSEDSEKKVLDFKGTVPPLGTLKVGRKEVDGEEGGEKIPELHRVWLQDKGEKSGQGWMDGYGFFFNNGAIRAYVEAECKE